jgi:hypothetical protein
LLVFVDWPPEISVAYLRDECERTRNENEDPSSEEEHAESLELGEWFRSLLHEAVNARLEPTLGSPEPLLETLPQSVVENGLDEYFTVQGLATVRGTVRRLKKLRTVEVTSPPSKTVRDYLRTGDILSYLYSGS